MNTSAPKQTPHATMRHPWEKYLPSKRIRIIIILIVVIAILYAVKNPIMSLFQKGYSKTVDTVVAIPLPQTEQQKTTLSIDKDTDADGLPDWQEMLIGTDPNSVTPADQVPKEIKELIATAEKSIITDDDKLALNVYNRLGTDPKGTNILEAVQAATAKEVLDLADSIDKNLTTYSINDINLVDDIEFNQETYSNQLKKIKSEATPSENVQKKIYELLTTGKTDIAITTYQIKLQTNIKKVLELPISVRTADIHLATLNALVHINDIISKNYSSVDPTNLYASLLVYQKNKNVFDQLSSF